jgi:type I restriction enzyme, S subunit
VRDEASVEYRDRVRRAASLSFPRYAEYRDSGVEWLGELPAHWEKLPARRIFRKVREAAKPQDEQLSATQKYGVIPQHLFMERDGQKVVQALQGTDKFLHVEPDDFVISLRSFEGGLEHSRHTGCVSPAYTVVRSRQPLIRDYWARLLKSAAFISVLQSVIQGIRDGKNVSYEQFGQVTLPVPPHDEQRRIASFVSAECEETDLLVVEQQQLIELLHEKRHALVSHAVTKGLDPNSPMKGSGVEWLGDIPAHWTVGPLKRFWTITDCKHITAEFVDNGVPVASIGEAKGYWVNLENAKQTTKEFSDLLMEGGRDPRAGDLIMTRNASVGDVAQVPVNLERFVLGQDVCLLRRADADMSPDYLQHALQSTGVRRQFERTMIGATFKRINVQDVRDLIIPWPPDQEQEEIATYLLQHKLANDSVVAQAESAIALLNERRTALISAAVTGKIDVRSFADSEAA